MRKRYLCAHIFNKKGILGFTQILFYNKLCVLLHNILGDLLSWHCVFLPGYEEIELKSVGMTKIRNGECLQYTICYDNYLHIFSYSNS